MRKLALAAVLASLAAPALAREPKTYQVTGPVVSVTDDMITVKKGSENWEIARTGDTKVTGDLKPGEKVTIQYRMTAASVEVKGGAAAKPKAAKAK